MTFQRNTLKNSMQYLVLIVIICACLASPCIAAGAGTKILPITPLGEMGSHQSNLSAHDYFDVVGILNLIENDRIIVGDSELKIASGVNAFRAQQWNLVGVKLNTVGEAVAIEIISDEPN